MEQRIIFLERLGGLKELALEQDNVLTKAQIRDYFDGTPLDESHFAMIFEYLRGQKIQIADSEEEAQEARDVQGTDVLGLYLSELEQLGEDLGTARDGSLIPDGADAELFDRVCAGEQEAREQLIQLYLPVVCELARDHEEEMPVEDLIQEGNLGLLLALGTLEASASLAARQAHLLNEINRAMEGALCEHTRERDRGERLVGRVNRLNDAVKSLEEELEHKVSMEELSAYLDMPLEEIRDILRIAGDAIELADFPPRRL